MTNRPPPSPIAGAIYIHALDFIVKPRGFMNRQDLEWLSEALSEAAHTADPIERPTIEAMVKYVTDALAEF